VDNRCADFCDLPAPTSAAPDDAHGRWCVSPAVGREVIADGDVGSVEISVDRVRDWIDRDEPTRVRLVVESVAGTTFSSTARLTSGSARQLAAELIHAADLADEIATPIAARVAC
jgi:hypothetical protein